MGISRMTAYVIASNEIEIIANGPQDGKWQGVITHSRLHERHPCMPILSSDFRYDSSEQAHAAMQQTVDEIREAVKQEMTHAPETTGTETGAEPPPT